MIPTDILNYRVVRLLGSGGMGSVYLAVNTNIDQQVAIKVLRPEFARNAELRARFKKEAELLCSLDHPGIVKFLNYVETGDGVFLIMEYVKGTTLENYIKRKNGLIVENKAYPLLKEILDAFEYAHSKGIVHQDIKPSNIIIQDDGHIKVMDFGIARIVSEAQHKGALMGTPEYMSPEQIYERPVDVRSDIYSLGVLIHSMLTGKAPYDSTHLTDHEIKRRIVKDELPRMVDYYPYVSDKIQKVVDKATQKNPEDRYQDCGEMKSAVKKAIAPDRIPKPLKYGGIAALAVVLIAAFFTWDYYRLKVDYYDDYVEIYGVPKGIGKLSGREADHRNTFYRFESQRGKVRRVSHVNSRGKIVPQTDSENVDKIVDMTLSYSEGSDKVDTETFRNQHGKVLYVKDFDSNLKTCTFKLDDELGTEMTLNSQVALFESSFDNTAQGGKSKISKYILDYDPDGYLSKVQYAGFGNILVPDGQGIFGREYVRDKKGRVVEEHYLGKDGTPKATQFGLGKKKFTYDDDGHLIKIVYLTLDGKPSSDGNNCPVVDLTYDKWGNRLKERYTDMEGNPMLRKDNQTAGYNYEYNNDGDLTKMLFIGIDGGLAYSNGVSGTIFEYDDNGYPQKIINIDNAGKPALYNDEGVSYSVIESVNNETGNPLEMRFLDITGKLIDTSQYSRKVMTYDSVGNLLTETYLDEKGNPYIPPRFGYAGYKIEYNPQGRAKTISFVNTTGSLMNLPDSHYSYKNIEYDVRGNVTKESFFDKDGKPVMTHEGISSVVFEYDENGNEIKRSFYNTNGKPCILNEFCSIMEMTYDDQGNVASRRFFNIDGKPMAVNGVSVFEYEYDKRGNNTRIRPLGINGLIAPGSYDTRYKYDDYDNVIEVAFFNGAGQPVIGADGFHRTNSKYNSRNLCTEQRYYDTGGRLINVKNMKYAVVKREYDAHGNKTSETFFDKSGSRGTDQTNVHKYFTQYDKVTNQVCHQISFGVDGKPIVADGIAPEGKLVYDARGNVLKLQCFDGYGKAAVGKHGWYEARMTYDDSGEKTSEAYFSLDGKPVDDNVSGYHKMTIAYNDMRMPASQSFFGKNGKPTVVTGNYSTMKLKYNNQNQRTEITYYGVNGKPVNTTAGWHKEVYGYKDGKETSCTFYDTAGRKVGSANKVNGNWVLNGGGGTVTSFGATPDWLSMWREAARECPMQLDEGIIVESVNIGTNRVTIRIRISQISLSDSDIDMSELKKQMENYLRRQTGTPSYVEINIIFTQSGDNSRSMLD